MPRRAEGEDRGRLVAMWRFQHEVIAAHALAAPVAGVDEAGRGPLAGPVVAAAVILAEDAYIPGLDDSKVLTERVREEVFVTVCGQALAYGVGEASAAEIDKLNILRATHLAMRRALASLPVSAAGALVDGLPVRGIAIPHAAVVQGDARCPSIAAASIIAKCHRDRMMVELDSVYPGYGLAKHKGYPTAEHVAALAKLGPTPIHRRSFHCRAGGLFPGQ